VGFSTGFGEYYLMEPSEAYAPIMKKVNEKIFISKTVIEFLLEDNSATYEDLLNRLQVWERPFTEGGLFSLCSTNKRSRACNFCK
jgi:DNA (cytosine-5)-methyltransferase 1